MEFFVYPIKISYADQIGDSQFYKFFYQFKAGMNGGPESEWTEPKIVSVVSTYGNNPGYGYAYLFVQYDQE